jgi:D-inositol-3-phosphate glycosyltransferase
MSNPSLTRGRLSSPAGRSERVRILFVSHYCLPHLGGIEVAVNELATVLAGRGHEVVHVASAAGGGGEQPERPYEVVTVPALNQLERHAGVPYPVYSPRLLTTLRREVPRADVVHAHGFLYMGTLPALRRARRTGAAAVLTEHVGHVHYDNRALDALERLAVASLGRAAARSAQGIVVLNEKVRAELQRLAPAATLETIMNGVDTERYRPPEPGEREALREQLGWDERPRALFVGRLVAKKGLDVAIEGAALAGMQLAVAGPGRLATTPGVEQLGALPRERVATLYRAADAFVLPSRGEGFPITAQEALASGLPVVLADDPSYSPYVSGAGAAVQLAEPTPEAVAAALSALMNGRGEAAASAAAHARRLFSWERCADQHEQLYERLRSASTS